MSYNIDTFKLKKLNNLQIPLASFYKHEREDWHPDRDLDGDGSVSLRMSESYVKGMLNGDIIHVEDILLEGEGSGTTVSWIIEPALKDSTGELNAVCIWEGGDSINKLIVKDGMIKWEDIEL